MVETFKKEEEYKKEIEMLRMESSLMRGAYFQLEKMIKELKEKEGQIKELMDLKNNFIKIVSHQLQTPLEVIRWTLNSILNGENGPVETDQKNLIHMAVRAEDNISLQLNDLLIVMDIGEKRVVLNKNKVQLESLLQTIFNEFNEESKIKKIVMTLSLPQKTLIPVEVDEERFKDIFRKLIDNAIVYSHEKGRVKVKLSVAGGNLRFEVVDTGIGIPKNEQQLIFQYFYRASNARIMREDSSGVGLSICKYFIEAHGGTMGFTSKEGKGSTFWFELPIKS